MYIKNQKDTRCELSSGTKNFLLMFKMNFLLLTYI